MNKNKKYMVLLISILSVLLACKSQSEIDLITDTPPKVSALQGKVKALVVLSNANKTTTEWVYDETTKQITGSKVSDSLAKSTTTQTFKRDTDGKLLNIAIAKTNADGSKSQSEKVYVYNSKNQVLSVTETFSNETIIEDFGYDLTNKLIKYTRSSKKGTQTSTLQLVQYTWQQGNINNKTDRSLAGGYEEEDYQYGTGENVLAKFYKEELQVDGGFTPEMLSQKMITSSQKLFEGSKYKYELEYSQANKLIGYKVSINKGGIWQTNTQVKVAYYE